MVSGFTCARIDAVVVSGAGPYDDAWHGFPETSSRVAQLIAGLGYRVDVRDDGAP
jgi:uncharacterized protein